MDKGAEHGASPCLAGLSGVLMKYFINIFRRLDCFSEGIEVEAENEEEAEDIAKEILHEGDSNWERAECDTRTS